MIILCELNLGTVQENQLLRPLDKYVATLKEQIHRRFDGNSPIVSAFSIFSPLTLPQPGSGAFKEHGTKQVKTLPNQFFFQGDAEEKALQEQLLAVGKFQV